MQVLNKMELQQAHGGLSSGEVATAAALAGKTFVEGLAANFAGNTFNTLPDLLIQTSASFIGVYGGFWVYHRING